jgi:hypothetical protein
MSTGKDEEGFFKILMESAIHGYGKERAKILEPSLREMARSLAAVSAYPLNLEDEPAFFSSAER